MSITDDTTIDAAPLSVLEPALPLASVVGERFTLVRRIGEGTFGVVYEAEDRAQRRRVALKMLRQPHPDWIHRFKREFRTLRDLTHRNLVALDELFCIGERWFFTMELLDGIDILSYARNLVVERPLPRERPAGLLHQTLTGSVPAVMTSDVTRIRHALRQLAAGLAVFHGSGRTHRDIKPSNLLVTHEQRVVVLDFGLATEATGDGLSTGSAVIGTPAYMAPEQAEGKPVTPAADLYAVGVLMHEMLTGRRPLPDASDLGPQVPRDLRELCLALLRRDPAQRPTAAQLQVQLQDADERIATLPANRSDTGFVGRSHEFAALTQAFQAARRGAPSVCVLHGESGIGKSRTVGHFLGELRRADPGVVVLDGECHEREAVPYKTIDGVLDALVRYLLSLPDAEVAALLPTRAGILASVFPAVLRLPSVAHHAARLVNPALPDLRARAFRELRDLMTRLAFAHPVVIAIDDLQWADEDGLRALAEIVKPPESPPLLVIGTLRTGPGAAPAAQLAALSTTLGVPVHAMQLAGLTPEDGRVLAARLTSGRAIADSDLERIATESAGHPLFIERLVDNLEAMASDELSLDHAIWTRVSELAPAQRRLIEVVAFAGRPLAPAIAAAAAEVDGAELAQLITTLCVARLARRASDHQIDIYHGRIRDAVQARVEPGRDRDLHARLATAYEAEPSPNCEAIAVHWQEAGEPARALGFIIRAGDTAARTLAFDRAAVWYAQAIAIVQDDVALRTDLRCRLGDALAHAGRSALAAAQFHDAAVASPPDAAIALHYREADQLFWSGNPSQALEVTTKILKMTGIAVPGSRMRLRASVLHYRVRLALRGLRFRPRADNQLPAAELSQLEIWMRAAYAMRVFNPLVALQLHTRSLLRALALGEPSRLFRALALELSYLGSFGRPAQRRYQRLLARMQAIAPTLPQPSPVFLASIGSSEVLNGAFESGLRATDSAIELHKKQSPGFVPQTVTMEMFSLHALAELGRYAELRRRQQDGLRDAIDRGDLYAQMIFSTGLSCLGWLVVDAPGDAEAGIAAAMSAWPKRPMHLQHVYALSSRFIVSLYRGDLASVASLSVDYIATAGNARFRRIQRLRVAIHYCRGSAAMVALPTAADRAAVLKDLAKAARGLEAEQVGWAQGFVHQLRAGLALHSGERAAARGALDHLERATASFERFHMMGYAMASRDRIARLQGREPDAAALAFFRDEGVVAPDRMIALLAPGLSTAAPGD